MLIEAFDAAVESVADVRRGIMSSMPLMPAYDGTKLAYQVIGNGAPVICLPGGPMQSAAYLGDLGGLPARVQLILADLRGTGHSHEPTDIRSYRCDRLVDDVEALREHLGLDRIDLLAHCAGANLAVLYAARHPERIGRLVLITPSTVAVGIAATSQMRRDVVQARADEPWFAAALTAFEAIQAGDGTGTDWEAITPFSYGRWDATARVHHASGESQRNEEAAAGYGAEGAYDPRITCAALATLPAQVLVVAGKLDVAAPPRAMTEMAALFPNAELVIQPGAGHFPWLDDPARFSTTISAFLS